MDAIEANRWFTLSAKGGHPKAQFNLGVHYQQGLGIAKDSAQAAYWLRTAADQGHERAAEALAIFGLA